MEAFSQVIHNVNEAMGSMNVQGGANDVMQVKTDQSVTRLFGLADTVSGACARRAVLHLLIGVGHRRRSEPDSQI